MTQTPVYCPQEEQVAEVETLVNRWIQEAHPVQTRVMALAEAKAAGAVAMFGEKYADTVCAPSPSMVCKQIGRCMQVQQGAAAHITQHA